MQELKNEYIRFWFEDGILCSEFINPVVLGLDEMKGMIELRHTISNNSAQYWLYDLRNVTSMPKAARDYAEIHGQEFLRASAVIVNSHITMFIFKIFVKIKTPVIPFQVFTDRKKAIEWLKELKKKNEK